MDGISDERSEDNRVNSLIEQVICLEEELQQTREENRILKENILNSNRSLSTEIIGVLSERIDMLRREIRSNPRMEREVLQDESIADLKRITQEFKGVLYAVEQEIGGLLNLCYSQQNDLQERDKQVQLYAQINSKLLLIKNEYVKLKQM
ncbi:hypothetical protein NEMIN01_0622 [Nematocida minor]|uniref:uncharacterized protein n=1 Tax=Nematocida minor TaxID=1912983 RepID=UPI00221E86B2|nr:uncharacterized protein NEMIN01_0622 [Nematocida minor]KAI5189669.1 hypothetical protein NEMIN01_0622 [Nematocida minor]